MEKLLQILRRTWYWALIYAVCYSVLTTLAIYKLSMHPLVPMLMALLPVLIVPLFYVGTLGYKGIKRQMTRRFARQMTEASFMILVLLLMVSCPAIILSLANTQAHLGAFGGDELGMPGYMLPMTLTVLLISGLLQVYITLLTYNIKMTEKK